MSAFLRAEYRTLKKYYAISNYYYISDKFILILRPMPLTVAYVKMA